MRFDRASGLFLHLTSLPGPDGIGTVGAPARRFVDFLAAADQSLWQFCPLGPTGPPQGNSPYSATSAFAASPVFVDLDDLHARGWLTDDDLAARPALPADRVAFERVHDYKPALLRRAFDRFAATADDDARAAFDAFREREADWLADYALFAALKAEFDGAWWPDWPAPARDRDPDALADYRAELARERRYHAFVQFCFDRQWAALADYAAERGVRLVGDLPIYVAHDSADVWAHRDAFQLDARGRAEYVAGVPDAEDEPFAAQRWGMPVYDWDYLASTGFDWWVRRVARLVDLVDLARVDHFRGLESYWAIPADEDDPDVGEWEAAPGEALFEAVRAALGDLPLFAEDLGHITPAVDRLRERFDLPGLVLVPFVRDWCDPDADYHPAGWAADRVAYASTHDSDTALGYYRDLAPDQRDCLAAVAERADAVRTPPAEAPHWTLVELTWGADAVLALAQVQDVLGLGSEARFNVPGTTADNWAWRVRAGQLTDDVAERLAAVTARTGRA